MSNKTECLTLEEIKLNLQPHRETFEYKVQDKIVRVSATVYRNNHGTIVLVKEIKEVND